jgi:hypothetical protein
MTAAAAAMVFVVTRPTERRADPVVAIEMKHDQGSAEPPVDVDDADLRFLVADPEAAAQTTADWKHITKPLRPYKKLLQGIR